MSNPGPQHNQTSPAAIVRHGFTRKIRIAVARRERWVMTVLVEVYDADIVNEICRLCDEFLAKHGTPAERIG